MANTILRSNEIVHFMGLFCLLLLVHKGDANVFTVGGQKGWSVPSDPNYNPYIQWAQKSRFQIGDSLVFNYHGGQDSVIPVNSQDYASCNTDVHSEKYSDGHTVIHLHQAGSHFFISGNKNNCLKNEKLLVIVMADRSNRNSNTNQTSTAAPSPSPSLSTTRSLAPSPASSRQQVPSPQPGTVQTPAPAQQQAASPPAPGTSATNPTPAPVSEPPPPPNAAASIIVSFAGSVGAFMASVLVLSF